MTVMTTAIIVVAVVLAACVAVLVRRGSSRASGPHVASSAELDAAARSSSARAADRQGLGPF